jgi:hypothetical protein
MFFKIVVTIPLIPHKITNTARKIPKYLTFFSSPCLCSSESALEALNQAQAAIIHKTRTNNPAKDPKIIFM